MEEGLVAQQEGRVGVVATARVALAGAGVQQRVVHLGVLVLGHPACPGPIAVQARVRRLPRQPLYLQRRNSCRLGLGFRAAKGEETPYLMASMSAFVSAALQLSLIGFRV